MQNAKNILLEVLQGLGWAGHRARFGPAEAPGLHASRVRVELHDGTVVEGYGSARRITQAEVEAAADALQKMRSHHPAYDPGYWERLAVEAQAGDALIKLAVYLADESWDAEARSHSLVTVETDRHLAELFDRWLAAGDPALNLYGPGLGEKKRATVVEALIWHRFRRALGGDAAVILAELRRALTPTIDAITA